MSGIEASLILLIAANTIISFKGFKDRNFFDTFLFDAEKVFRQNQLYRLFTSGFLHADWMHLGFNMIGLYTFGKIVGFDLTTIGFWLVYIGSLFFGNLLSLYIHRHDEDYSAVGAYGAVSGVVFSQIIMHPENEISLIIFPSLGIPAWIYGFAFIFISLYGIKNHNDNIGHDAHLGGAIAGVFLTLAMHPSVFKENTWTFFLVLFWLLIGLYFVTRFPDLLALKKYNTLQSRTQHERNRPKTDEEELNELLDKIKEKGLNQLTRKERKRLEDLSKK